MRNIFQFETFVDIYSNIFQEYLSTVIAELPRENETYRAARDEIEDLYKQYPKVLNVLDLDKAEALNEEECAVLIKALELKNRLTDMEMESVYFRGCYDSVGYLKKAGVTIHGLE